MAGQLPTTLQQSIQLRLRVFGGSGFRASGLQGLGLWVAYLSPGPSTPSQIPKPRLAAVRDIREKPLAAQGQLVQIADCGNLQKSPAPNAMRNPHYEGKP